MGGLDKDSNYVLLTAKEHILAHLLLARIYYNNIKVVSASIAMTMTSTFTEDRSNLSLRSLALSRELFSNVQKGKRLTEQHRKNIGKSNKGRKRVQTSWGNKISEAKKGKAYGVSVKDPKGNIFRTLSDCAKEYNVSAETIKYWITNIPSRGFSLIESKEILSTSKGRAVICSDGTIYSSITKCSKAIGVDRHTLSNWVKNFPEKGYKFIE
jgi:hypothetical protein